MKVGGDTYVLSMPAIPREVNNADGSYYVFPFAKVTIGKDTLAWGFDLVFGNWSDSSTVSLIDTGGQKALFGEALHRTRYGDLPYKWMAEQIHKGFVPPAGLESPYTVFCGFSPKVFEEGIAKSKDSKLLYLPVPQDLSDLRISLSETPFPF